jgi:hypothetical protein
MEPSRQPHPIVLRWESLDTPVQVVVCYPVLALLFAILHLTVLSQPLGRGIAYGLFWAAPATVLVIVATAHERRKRQRPTGDA